MCQQQQRCDLQESCKEAFSLSRVAKKPIFRFSFFVKLPGNLPYMSGRVWFLNLWESSSKTPKHCFLQAVEMASPIQGNDIGACSRGCQWLKALPFKSSAKVVELARKMKKLAKDDPRRVIHSLKVGLALTLVSLFYYFEPLYDGFGVNAIWAVLTVVVVFEFSVGATLGKGLNRMLSTLVAGTLGVGAHHLATLSGQAGEPIVIAIFVFVIAATVTFTRFFPALKARYDYGLTIFILTFCLVSVSGYRDDQVIKMAHMRLSTIIIGSSTAIIISICIFPVWIGEDLHNLVVGNMEKLGNYLEGFGSVYFEVSEERLARKDRSFLQGYATVLTSKSNEETMANLARWEPGHGRFRFFHPWKQYLKIGTLTRECAYKIEALNIYLNSDIQTPVEIRNKWRESCIKISLECGKTLKELASATKEMRRTKSVDPHITNSKLAAENVKFMLEIINIGDGDVLMDVVPVATVAFLLSQVVESIDKISEAVQELASLADFKSLGPDVSLEHPHLLPQGTAKPISTMDAQNHVIDFDHHCNRS